MKKIILFAFLVIFSLSAIAITPDSRAKTGNTAVPERQENKISEEDIKTFTRRAEEIDDLDKSKQTVIVRERHRSRRGHDGINRGNRRNGGVVFIGGGGVLLLILLIILLV